MGLWKEVVIFVVAVAAILVVAGQNGSTPDLSPGSAATPASSVPASSVASPDPTPVRPGGGPAAGEWDHGVAPGQLVRQIVSVKSSASFARTMATAPPSPNVVSEHVSATMSSPTPTDTSDSAPPLDSTALGPTVPDVIRQWEPLILKYSGENGLDPNLVAAVMMTESGGNPLATSKKGAVGLMQVVNGSYDPDSSVRDGTRILANDLRRYGGDLELSLAAYNAGAGAVDRFGGIPPYGETETYIFEVLNRYYLYSTA